MCEKLIFIDGYKTNHFLQCSGHYKALFLNSYLLGYLSYLKWAFLSGGKLTYKTANSEISLCWDFDILRQKLCKRVVLSSGEIATITILVVSLQLFKYQITIITDFNQIEFAGQFSLFYCNLYSYCNQCRGLVKNLLVTIFYLHSN